MKTRTRIFYALLLAGSFGLGSLSAFPPIPPENLPPGVLRYYADAQMTQLIGIEVIPCQGPREFYGTTSMHWHHAVTTCGGNHNW